MFKPLIQISLVLILLLANLGQAISAGAALFCSEPPSKAQNLDKIKEPSSMTVSSEIKALSLSQGLSQTEADCCDDCCDAACVCIANPVQTTAFVQAKLAEGLSVLSGAVLIVPNQKPIWRSSTLYRPPIPLS